eukprot:7344855-Prymnesium_polylepis.1
MRCERSAPSATKPCCARLQLQRWHPASEPSIAHASATARGWRAFVADCVAELRVTRWLAERRCCVGRPPIESIDESRGGR